MSLESVKAIIDRALSDAEYQKALFACRADAFEGYELTDAEIAALRNLALGTSTSTHRGLIEAQKSIQAAFEYRIDQTTGDET